MPPRTRTAKTTKGLKENIAVVEKTKVKPSAKLPKPARKALADKTNSASDENASPEIPKKVTKKSTLKVNSEINEERPRRERRLPKRFIENEVLNSLSVSKEVEVTPCVEKIKTPKNIPAAESPYKTPHSDPESSLVANRPRRICRLPSRFEDHSVSPNKFIPVQPVNSSTPIVHRHDTKTSTKKVVRVKDDTTQKTTLKATLNNVKSTHKDTKVVSSVKTVAATALVQEGVLRTPEEPVINQAVSNKKASKPSYKKVEVSNKNIKADTNNNANSGRTLRKRPAIVKLTSPKDKSPTTTVLEKPRNKEYSFSYLEDKINKETDAGNQDVYEFTYDPNEEPHPQKKKKKKIVKKRPAKLKAVFFNNNYDKNISKALIALKNVVQKPSQSEVTVKPVEQQIQSDTVRIVPAKDTPVKQNAGAVMQQSNLLKTTNIPITHNPIASSNNHNMNSINVEDIRADFESTIDYELNYSPVNTPISKTPPQVDISLKEPSIGNSGAKTKDPLNLRDDISFFDDQPVASSSMNMSVRHPTASPWRVEFRNLPIKWQVNSYVKPNMTPAVECSFVNFEEGKKKHVYTNMVADDRDIPLPEIVATDQPSLKQPSIISFFKEVVEKKKRGRSSTPLKTNLVENTNILGTNTVSRKPNTPQKNNQESQNVENNEVTPENSAENISSKSSDKENSRPNHKRKIDHDSNAKAKAPRKDDVMSYFGFDDSDNQDQENISPKKKGNGRKLRSLRSRGQAVLKQINEQTGPTRAVLPVSVKTKASSETINKVFDEIKSATDAPVFPEKNIENVGITSVNDIVLEEINDEDSQTVHLFEDIEIVHHMKPQRKSYGKAKKVAFRQPSTSDSNIQEPRAERAQSEVSEDDLNDIAFELPTFKEKTKKKVNKRPKMTKKEEQEAEAWAAGFNSMCEEVDEFTLVVE